MATNSDSKKLELTKEITSISSEKELDELIKYVKIKRLTPINGASMFKGIKKTISVEELKKEQNFKGIDRTEFDKLVEDLDVKESIEELLAILD